MPHYIEAIGRSFERQKTTFLAQHPQEAVEQMIFAHQPQAGTTPLLKIKNIIAVASGKGGVGKSTIAFNLAATLAAQGLRVAMLDADIYGPSLPILSGVQQRAIVRADKLVEPHQAFGMQILSIGHLVDAQEALIWRGPMASGALMQLFTQAAWALTDVMVVDLPPGTGDLLLTLCQKIPLAGVVMVTQRHPLAQADVARSLKMFEKLHIRLLGTICNDLTPVATSAQADHLGQLCYSQAIYDATAQGQPVARLHPNSTEDKLFQHMAEQLIDRLSQTPRVTAIPLTMTGL